MQFLEAMIEAGRIRLRPILMTAVATIAGATPIALGLGAGAASRRPLGYAVVGGLIFSTVLTLFLVPVVWTSFEAARERVHARRRAREGQPAVAQPVAATFSRAEAP
jgi:HAE1 family hydrophobic/amphiphilic exporter-1